MRKNHWKKLTIGVTAATVFSVVPFAQPATAEAGWLGDVLGSVIGAAATPKNAEVRNSATQIDKILHQACKDNDYDMAVDAINKGANVNSHWQDTLPLAYALNYADDGDFKMANMLLEHGADPDGWYDSKHCHYFAWSHLSDDTVLYLLDHGMNINLKDEINVSLLMERVVIDSYNNKQPKSYYIQQLVNRGADVNTRATGTYIRSERSHYYLKGETALFGAVGMDDIESARVLLYAGARTDYKNENGKTALDYAIDRGNRDMIKLLMNWHGAE